MSQTKRQEGERGETIAVSYLKKHGYTIIERNFRTRNGEIDVIAIDHTQKPHTLCFIEVKTRTTLAYGTPLEAIGYYKLQALQRTAAYYVLSHPHLPEHMRLDAVSIILSSDMTPASIELVKNIG